MLGNKHSAGDVLSIWDGARLSVGILLLRVPMALSVAASGHVQFYLLFTHFPPAALQLKIRAHRCQQTNTT